jgi:hypothetical protein
VILPLTRKLGEILGELPIESPLPVETVVRPLNLNVWPEEVREEIEAISKGLRP